MKVASAIASRQQRLRDAKPDDPSAILASAITRRLAAVQLVGSAGAVRKLESRITSALTHTLQKKPEETEGKAKKAAPKKKSATARKN